MGVNGAEPEFGNIIIGKSASRGMNYIDFTEWYLKNIKPKATITELIEYIKDHDLLSPLIREERVTNNSFGVILGKFGVNLKRIRMKNVVYWMLKEEYLWK